MPNRMSNFFQVPNNPFSSYLPKDPNHQKLIDDYIAKQKSDFIEGGQRLYALHRSDSKKTLDKMGDFFEVLKERSQSYLGSKGINASPEEINSLIQYCENFMTMLCEELPENKEKRRLERKSSLNNDLQPSAEAVAPAILPEPAKAIIQDSVSTVKAVETEQVRAQLPPISEEEEKKARQQKNILNEIASTEEIFCTKMTMFFNELKKIAISGSRTGKKFSQELLSFITEKQIQNLTTNPFKGNLDIDSFSKIMESDSFKERMAILGFLTARQSEISAKLRKEKLSYKPQENTTDIKALSILPVQRGPRYVLFLGELEKKITPVENPSLAAKIAEGIKFLKKCISTVNSYVDYHKNLTLGITDKKLDRDFNDKTKKYFAIQTNSESTPAIKQAATTQYTKDTNAYNLEKKLRQENKNTPLKVSAYLPTSDIAAKQPVEIKTSTQTKASNALPFLDNRNEVSTSSVYGDPLCQDQFYPRR